MRALCGAIITAGALIGLGLTALGIGTRYQAYAERRDGTLQYLHFHDLDTPLMLILIFTILVGIAGLAVAFVGLAYHHHRRHHEFLKEHGHLSGHQHTTV